MPAQLLRRFRSVSLRQKIPKPEQGRNNHIFRMDKDTVEEWIETLPVSGETQDELSATFTIHEITSMDIVMGLDSTLLLAMGIKVGPIVIILRDIEQRRSMLFVYFYFVVVLFIFSTFRVWGVVSGWWSW